jgi:CRISPR/Cas system-associated exonuclease Cas4 (RecB family)
MVVLDKFFFDSNSWSFTRHRIWKRCKRQYYYEYIAQYVKSQALIDSNKIRLLKVLNSKFVLQGQIIHYILNKQIKLHCEGKLMDPAGALNAYSRKVALFKNMADEMLIEYQNGELVDPQFFSKIDESGKVCLHMFFENKWPNYHDRECLRHEEFDHFRIGNIEVMIKVDFVNRMPNGTIVLTDWKTGKDDNEYETELQMAAYVIWAMQYYQKSPDEIMSELVFLKTGETKPYPFYEERLREVQEMITTDFEAMNTTYEYEDFPARPVLQVCLSCRFARVCPEAVVVRK